jgi:hypothetical protein
MDVSMYTAQGSEVLVGELYKVGKKIGAGTFGDIYLGRIL